MPTFAYVVNSGDNNVAVIDISTNTLVATIPINISPSLPRFIAITPDGRFAYVTNENNFVTVIDTSTNRVVKYIPLPLGYFSNELDITPDGNFVYVVNSELDNVSVIATSSNLLVANISVGDSPFGIAITPDGNFAYVTNSGSDNVSVINTSTNTVVATIPVGDYPLGVEITPDGNFAYVANTGQLPTPGNTVSVIDTRTNTVVATITVGLGPIEIAFTPDGNFAYVTDITSYSVSVISTATNTVVATIFSVGLWPVDITITPDGAFAYVTNWAGDNVSVISTSTNRVVTTITVGDGPLGIAIASIGQQQGNVSLKVTKEDSPDPVRLGEKLTYRIQVTNNGSDTASEVILTDTLPQGVDFISASSNQGTCSESNGVVTCELGTMDVNETVTVTVTVKPRSTGTICNKVAVSAGGSQSESWDNTALQCTTVLRTVCIEAKRVFDSCVFEEVKQKIFKLPSILKDQDFECKIVETDCKVLEVNRIHEEQNLADVKLRIKVVVEFRNRSSNDQAIKGVVSFDKSITLNSPEGSDICCSAHATCKCIQSNDYMTGSSCDNMFPRKIYCEVKVTAAIKCEKLVQIEVPFLDSCGRCQPHQISDTIID